MLPALIIATIPRGDLSLHLAISARINAMGDILVVAVTGEEVLLLSPKEGEAYIRHHFIPLGDRFINPQAVQGVSVKGDAVMAHTLRGDYTDRDPAHVSRWKRLAACLCG